MQIFRAMGKCEECGFEGNMIEENFGISIIVFCPECYNFKLEFCTHEKSSLVKMKVNDGYRVRRMCSSCYTIFGTFVKQAGLDMSSIKEVNKESYDRWHEEQERRSSKRINEIRDRREAWKKQRFFENYNKYLNSPAWKERREEVLKRDNYLCQSCLKARATQVHHLSYKHWGDEPLFELISVCAECHERITRMDQIENLITQS